MHTPTARRVGAVALGVAFAGAVAALGPGDAGASSHREAPLIAADPAVDNTDVYAFVSPDRPGYVTFIANFIPFEEPNGGPNFRAPRPVVAARHTSTSASWATSSASVASRSTRRIRP